ncbi:MAG: ABC transporter ATP-binding protein, partial [Verrucomicrobia bacterium]|nr:ABC transporter ATP-binding protein [Verrucomicrobiota bacterium]
MNETVVEIAGVTKAFGKVSPLALKGITASIPKGQIVGLAGPDGAGKTTLMRLIAAILRPSSGAIHVAGFDTTSDPEAIHQIIGYMPQKFGLYEDLTVQQNLDLYADLRGVLGDERAATFQRLLTFTALAPFTDRPAGKLSGGMKQKLGLACALIKKPQVLLLDEPGVGVDPISRRELWKMVHELLGEGISVLWSTAYLDEAAACDSVLLLSEGELVYSGKPADLTDRVKERVYRVTQIETNRRQVLVHALRMPDVIDGVIQGSDVRMVFKEKPVHIDVEALQAGPRATIRETAPRFEDAFVDILGGGPGGRSILAEHTPEVLTTRDTMIEVTNLTRRFGSFTAVDNISLKIRPGEIFGLLGPNGAGKSTTFRMMCGLLKPTAGSAIVNGVDLLEAPSQARARIGYMAQKFSLYGNLSVRENLEFFSGIYNLQGKEREDAVKLMIEIFNFDHYVNESAEILPLGYKQR